MWTLDDCDIRITRAYHHGSIRGGRKGGAEAASSRMELTYGDGATQLAPKPVINYGRPDGYLRCIV